MAEFGKRRNPPSAVPPPEDPRPPPPPELEPLESLRPAGSESPLLIMQAAGAGLMGLGLYLLWKSLSVFLTIGEAKTQATAIFEGLAGFTVAVSGLGLVAAGWRLASKGRLLARSERPPPPAAARPLLVLAGGALMAAGFLILFVGGVCFGLPTIFMVVVGDRASSLIPMIGMLIVGAGVTFSGWWLIDRGRS